MSHVIRDSRGTSYELVSPRSPGKSTDKIPLLFEDDRVWKEIYSPACCWGEANFLLALAIEEMAGRKPCPLMAKIETNDSGIEEAGVDKETPKKIMVIGCVPGGKPTLSTEVIRQAVLTGYFPVICTETLDGDGGICVDPELKKLIGASVDSPMLQSLVDVRQEPVLAPKPKSYAEMFHPVVGKRHKRKKKQRF